MPKGKTRTRINYGYGAIYIRKTKTGRVGFYADYRDRNKKRKQQLIKKATSWGEAHEWLKATVRNEHHKECGTKEQKSPVMFKDFVDMFIRDYSRVNKASWKDDQCRLQKCIPSLGKIYLDEITPQDIEKLKSQKLSEGLAKTTVNHYLKILKRSFNVAIDWGYAKDNPVRRVQQYPEYESKRERILTDDEEIRLLRFAPVHLRPILVVALHTGMRKGEILNLKWDDIDFQRREIHIRKSKTGRPRVIDINTTLLEQLTSLRKPISSTHVFTNPKTGKPYTKIQKSFERARILAGIEDVRFHDLRHTFASRLIARGVDIIKVKDFLGHTSVKTTERYTHSSREERKRAIELLCEKPSKSAQKQAFVWHPRYTKTKDKDGNPVTPYFSVN